MTGALASATLARLYLAQGHPGRARTTLEEVLELEPYNGVALALWERVRLGPQARVLVRLVSPGMLEIEWSLPARQRGRLLSRVELAVAIASPDGTLRLDSRSCPERSGHQRVPAPVGPASVAVALIGHEHGSGPRVVAVGEHLSW